MNESGEIRVLAFGSATSLLGWSERSWPASAFSQLQQLVEHLESQFPQMAAARGRVRYAINRQYAGLETPLQAGDEVALIPPVSGG